MFQLKTEQHLLKGTSTQECKPFDFVTHVNTTESHVVLLIISCSIANICKFLLASFKSMPLCNTLACKCDGFPSQLEIDAKIDIFKACHTAMLDIHFIGWSV